jgi:hypothetical protein
VSPEWLRPDRAVLATAVADTVVVASDGGAREASLFYWELAQPWVRPVVEAVLRVEDVTIREAARRLTRCPADPSLHETLRRELLRAEDRATAGVFELAWRAECNSRLGYHGGSRSCAPHQDVAQALFDRVGSGPPLPRGADPEILVIIPFRETSMAGSRVRNLLASLLALRDQSLERDAYRVTVVESDEVPRWQRAIAPWADSYVFAPKKGPFNKAWTVNVGVVNAPGSPELVCVLDADILIDRDFLARNAARFAVPGTGAHLPYRDALCLDPWTSETAIVERCERGAAAPALELLRGFLLRRPPGGCIWLRAEVFRRIAGMDERYEGWGGEDNDFAFRIDLDTPLDLHCDPLLHLHHPPVSFLVGGKPVNAVIPPLSWLPDTPIGLAKPFRSG